MREQFVKALRKMPLPAVKVNPKVKNVKLLHGWLLDPLLKMDAMLWGRWEYWIEAQTWNPEAIPDTPIPQIDWQTSHSAQQMLVKCLDAIPQQSWLGWSSWDYFRYFLQWLLFGFGHHGQPELPEEPPGCQGASDRLYQLFQLGAMQIFPDDYFGNLLAESQYGKQQGFYPTPMPVCYMMAEMTFSESEDSRTLRCADPCCGTGRFPLVMSNHSLCVVAQDIDETLVMATLVNAYIYAPWVARPIWWLGGNLLVGNSLSNKPGKSISYPDPASFNASTPAIATTVPAPFSAPAPVSAPTSVNGTAGDRSKYDERVEALKAISDTLTDRTQNDPRTAQYLNDTEFDPETVKWNPILKRKSKRKNSSESDVIGYQGSLF